ncbi:hypothetical protein BGZ82_006042 [Podila clonocystis]|nr:hypothetical protein BGZ82_006042 [Podila clonocystis]
MASAMDIALNLPEIIQRIGWFLPLWEPHEEQGDSSVLVPQHLAACTRVCHTWRKTLLPFLGRVYDGEEMERWNIAWPNYLSPHCRLARLNTTILLEHPYPTLLTELEVYTTANHAQTIQVLYSNLHLQRLSWSIPDTNAISHTDVITALESLSSLRSLTLDSFRWCFGRFSHVINRNAEMTRLRMRHCRGLEDIEKCLFMDNVKELYLDCAWRDNAGLLSLIRGSPNLESLMVRLDQDCPLIELCEILQERCPKVAALTCTRLGREEEAQSGTIIQDQIATLVGSIKSLRCLELNVYELSDEICSGLLDIRAGDLERVKIVVHRDSKESLTSANRILATCAGLRSFSITRQCSDPFWYDSTWSYGVVSALFEKAWVCAGLESLIVGDIEDPSRRLEYMDAIALTVTIEHCGWKMKQSRPLGRHGYCLTLALAKKVVEQAVHMARLKAFKVNRFTFVRQG